jgi:hypothetical protein
MITMKQKKKALTAPQTKAFRGAFCDRVEASEIGISGVMPKRTVPATRRKECGSSLLQTDVAHENINSLGSLGSVVSLSITFS